MLKNPDHYKSMMPWAELEKLWEAEQKEHGLETYGKTGKYLTKFKDYFQEKLDVFKHLQLDNGVVKAVLDLGTGVGYFPWLCDQYGQLCDFSDLRPLPFYKRAHELLKLKGAFYDFGVFGQQRFELTKRYDIITAHRTVFDIFDYHWYVDEWRFFLINCADFLNEGGVVFIKTNLVQGAHLHSPHPAFMRFIQPYEVTGFNSICFKITKEQILADLV